MDANEKAINLYWDMIDLCYEKGDADWARCDLAANLLEVDYKDMARAMDYALYIGDLCPVKDIKDHIFPDTILSYTNNIMTLRGLLEVAKHVGGRGDELGVGFRLCAKKAMDIKRQKEGNSEESLLSFLNEGREEGDRFITTTTMEGATEIMHESGGVEEENPREVSYDPEIYRARTTGEMASVLLGGPLLLCNDDIDVYTSEARPYIEKLMDMLFVAVTGMTGDELAYARLDKESGTFGMKRARRKGEDCMRLSDPMNYLKKKEMAGIMGMFTGFNELCTNRAHEDFLDVLERVNGDVEEAYLTLEYTFGWADLQDMMLDISKSKPKAYKGAGIGPEALKEKMIVKISDAIRVVDRASIKPNKNIYVY